MVNLFGIECPNWNMRACMCLCVCWIGGSPKTSWPACAAGLWVSGMCMRASQLVFVCTRELETQRTSGWCVHNSFLAVLGGVFRVFFGTFSGCFCPKNGPFFGWCLDHFPGHFQPEKCPKTANKQLGKKSGYLQFFRLFSGHLLGCFPALQCLQRPACLLKTRRAAGDSIGTHSEGSTCHL